MKKLLCILWCGFLIFLVACASRNGVLPPKENREIINSGEYFCIYKEDADHVNLVHYEIYNLRGEVVMADSTDRALVIQMVNDHIMDIEIGMGTGISVHRYYDVERDIISENFMYVIANSDALLAYIDTPEKHPFENRKIVIQNAFDKDVFCWTYQLPFSKIDTPVIHAEFTKDGKFLQITYLSGEKQIEISEKLALG